MKNRFKICEIIKTRIKNRYRSREVLIALCMAASLLAACIITG